MMSYAGVPLLDAVPELIAFAAQNVNPEEVWQFAERHWPGPGLPFLDGPPAWPRRPLLLDSLYWPTGASRFATFHALAGAAQVELIRAAVFPTSQDYLPAALVLDDGKGGRLEAPLWLLPPRPLQQTAAGRDVYLLTLVDDRYFWWARAAELSVAPPETSWESLYLEIANALGITLAVDPVPAVYPPPAAELGTRYQALPPLLDAVARTLGQKIVRQPGGTVRAWNAPSALAAEQQQLAALAAAGAAKNAGGVLDMDGQGAAALPHSLTFVFPQSDDGRPAAAAYPLEVPSGLGTSHKGTLVVHAGRLAQFKDDLLQNGDELGALASQYAADWYAWQKARLDLVLLGFYPWTLTGREDYAEWRRGGDATLRVCRGPFDENTWRLHFAAQATRDEDDVEFVRVETLDLVDGRYPGWLLDHDPTVGGPGTYTDVRPIWVVDVDGGTLETTRYLAKRSPPTLADGKDVFVADQQGGAGAGTLTVREADYDPTLPERHTLVFDSATGLKVRDGGPGEAVAFFDGFLTVREADLSPTLYPVRLLTFDQAAGLTVTPGAAGEAMVRQSGAAFLTVRDAHESPTLYPINLVTFDQATGLTVTPGPLGSGEAIVRFSGSVAAGITVREADGSPTLFPTTTLTFNQAHNFVVTPGPLGSNEAIIGFPATVTYSVFGCAGDLQMPAWTALPQVSGLITGGDGPDARGEVEWRDPADATFSLKAPEAYTSALDQVYTLPTERPTRPHQFLWLGSYDADAGTGVLAWAPAVNYSALSVLGDQTPGFYTEPQLQGLVVGGAGPVAAGAVEWRDTADKRFRLTAQAAFDPQAFVLPRSAPEVGQLLAVKAFAAGSGELEWKTFGGAAGATGSGLTWLRVDVDYTDFNAGAIVGTQSTRSLYLLPPAGYLHGIVMSHTQIFAAPGVGNFPLDVLVTAGTGAGGNILTYALGSAVPGGDKFARTHNLASLVSGFSLSVGSTLSARVTSGAGAGAYVPLTSGRLVVWLLTSALPDAPVVPLP